MTKCDECGFPSDNPDCGHVEGHSEWYLARYRVQLRECRARLAALERFREAAVEALEAVRNTDDHADFEVRAIVRKASALDPGTAKGTNE